MKTEPNVIQSVDLLSELLGDEFVILFGSAVSGVGSPRLPMVGDAMSAIIRLISARLRAASKTEQIVADYADALITGKFKSILWTTKFETFLLRLTRAVGKDNVDNLLTTFYVCEGNEFGFNHSAIAFLLRKRICLAALTTNFDNALELSYPDIRVLDHFEVPPRLPESSESPWLLKLHGDAKARTL